MRIGGEEWKLDAGRPMLMASLPGTYRLTLDDAGMIDETGLLVTVEIMRLAPGAMVIR
jgi:hypothetical protein